MPPASVLPSFSTLLPPLHLSYDLLCGVTADSAALSKALAWSRHSGCAQWFHVHSWTPGASVSNTHTLENTSFPVFSQSVASTLQFPLRPLSPHTALLLLFPHIRSWMDVFCVSESTPPLQSEITLPRALAFLSLTWTSQLCLCVGIPAFPSCPLKSILLHTVARLIWRKLRTLPRLRKDWNKGQGLSVLSVRGDSRKVLVRRRLAFSVFHSANQEPKGSFLRQLDKVSHLSYKINAWGYIRKIIV